MAEPFDLNSDILLMAHVREHIINNTEDRYNFIPGEQCF